MANYIEPKQDMADEGVLSGVEYEDSGGLQQPFDPSSISLDTKVVSLFSVLRRIENKSINLSPPFQRNAVWDDKRKSLLIESMMLRIPLPMFYVAEDREGNWEVVDGLQRLTAINSFIKGPDNDGKGFKLKELEFWGDRFNGKTFFQLERMLEASMTVNHILETELQFTIIKPDTSEKVKRNIFKRINTGGMRLSEQEIRHALYQGRSTSLLINLRSKLCFSNGVGKTIDDSRMAAREIILRFIAFKVLGRRFYKGDMDDFLSLTMSCINEGFIELEQGDKKFVFVSPEMETIDTDFELSIERNMRLFGEHAFRRSIGNERKSPINKSLFDTWMVCLSYISDAEFKNLIERKDDLLHDYMELLNGEVFGNSISRHSASINGVSQRYESIISLIGRYK